VVLNLDVVSTLFVFLAGVAAAAVSYYAVAMGRMWFGKRPPDILGALTRRPPVGSPSLNAHIATEWTDGRLRLDSLLALIKALGTSLEHEVETLSHLDPSDRGYNSEARHLVEPTLRRFTFDRHLRNECRVLVPLLLFCANDLNEFQGMDMTAKIAVLGQIQVVIDSFVTD
jgi:hypothetical protein